LGTGGRKFESCRPDHLLENIQIGIAIEARRDWYYLCCPMVNHFK